MFGELNVFRKDYNIMNDFFFMENVLTSFEPTLSNFDESAVPQFMDENRTEVNLSTLKAIHQAILDYFKRMELKTLKKVDRTLSDCIFRYIQRDFCKINTYYFINAKLQDAFCNREFDLSDTIK